MSLRLSLRPHPDTPCPPLTGIEVELARVRPLRLHIRYTLLGNWRKVRLRNRERDPGDELWRHTCFEAFVRVGDEQSYLEYNLALSGHFAAYRFDRYREGMAPAKEVASSILDVQSRSEPLDRDRRARLKEAGFDTLERFEPSFYSLKAELAFSDAMGLAVAQPWHLGLSTIVEERDKAEMSYWALAHPAGEPDFHHPDCFQLELPAARPA